MKKQDEVKKIIQDALASESEKIITNAGNLDLTGLFYWCFPDYLETLLLEIASLSVQCFNAGHF
jgi:hypothetical protein